MDAARKGILTPEIKTVAQKEHMSTDEMMKLVAEGKVAICANKNHTCLNPEGVGSMLRTKINVNLGVSRDCKDYDIEMQKVMSAVNLGAEAIMDLSSHGNTQPFRQKLTHECPAMIGTVPVYDSVIHYQRDLATLTSQDFVDVVRLHAEDGVDFVTLHIMCPCTFCQFAEAYKLFNLAYVCGIGQTSRAACITKGDVNIVFFTDIQNLVEMFIERIFFSCHAHPCKYKTSSTATLSLSGRS